MGDANAPLGANDAAVAKLLRRPSARSRIALGTSARRNRPIPRDSVRASPRSGSSASRHREPAAPWDGALDAAAFGPTAPQSPYGGALGELIKVPAIAGTNILTVNVWAPADAANAPVVLWLHGGALERGAAAQSGYDGEHVRSRRDRVRLGELPARRRGLQRR